MFAVSLSSLLMANILAASGVGAQVATVVSTFTEWITTTTTLTQVYPNLCASYINASAPCKRRRKEMILPPIFFLDFNPTINLNRIQETQRAPDTVELQPRHSGFLIGDDVQPSYEVPRCRHRFGLHSGPMCEQYRMPDPFFWAQAIDLFSAMLRLTRTVSLTVTSTKMSTSTLRTTASSTTATMFIQACMPIHPYFQGIPQCPSDELDGSTTSTTPEPPDEPTETISPESTTEFMTTTPEFTTETTPQDSTTEFITTPEFFTEPTPPDSTTELPNTETTPARPAGRSRAMNTMDGPAPMTDDSFLPVEPDLHAEPSSSSSEIEEDFLVL